MSSLPLRLAVLAFALSSLISVGADTASDLSFTAFRTADPNTLAGGQVLQARGGLIEFERGLTAQALYIIDAPPETVRAKLVTWNPASHRELEVWLHQNLSARPQASEYATGLQHLPDNSSVRNLVNATAKLDPNEPALQVDKSEAQLIVAAGSDPHTRFVNGWSQVLAGRVSRFLGGNISADHYSVSDGDISPLSEIKSLLRSDALVYRRVHSLLVNTPVYNSNRAVPATLYFECFDVEGCGSIGTGAVYQSSAAPGSPILSADIEYFVNNGIYVSIELEQLSPITINGKTETLVWRNDLVSTSNVAYLHGTERLASGMLMLQDVKQAVDAFRTEFK
jgi:hypothetical protein